MSILSPRPTTSPLATAADAVAEATVLIALLALPLYFTVLTETGYEPDKAVLLRTLATVGLAGWMVSRSAIRPLTHSGKLIILTGTILLAIYVVAGLLSIDMRLSFWGSQTRQQGVWTWAAYLVLLVIAATRLRSFQAVNRLVTCLLLGSVPVVVYAYLQQFGLDPIPAAGDPTTLQWPVRSTLGQHVFLGSYLVMVLPFTASRLFDAVLTRREQLPSGGRALSSLAAVVLVVVSFLLYIWLGVSHPALFALLPALLAGYAGVGVVLASWEVAPWPSWYFILLVLQILALFFTGARASWLAALATVPVLGLLVAYRLGRRALALRMLVATVAVAIVLLLLNIPGGPLQPLRTMPALARVSNITDSGGAGGSGQGRVLIWQGVTRLLADTPPIGPARGGMVRDLIGYGPESMHWAFQAVFPLRLRQVTSEIWTWDRAHNVYLDRLLDGGILALLAFLALAGLTLWRSVRELRLASPSAAVLLAGMSAAVVGHLVDGLFSLETAVTLSLLFAIAGLTAGLPWNVPAPSALLPRPIPRWLPAYFGGLFLVGLLSVLLGVERNGAALAALLVLGSLAGVGAVAALLSEGRMVSWRTWLGPVPLVAAALTTLALASQFWYQTGAVDERLGLDRLSAGDVAAAVSYLQQAVRADGNEPQYLTELGGAYLSFPTRDSANPSFVPHASQLTSLNEAQVSRLGTAQLVTLSRLALDRARQLAPLDPDAYGNLGNVDLQANQPTAALREYREAEALSHENPRYLDQEALAELQMGKGSQALGTARHALALDSTYWLSHYALAAIDDKRGDTAGAKREAALALYWQRNIWPHPPAGQISQLRSLASTG